MNIINMQNISKSFSEKKLIDNINLGINEGDKIGFIGLNGSGKTTLLKIIAGVLEADSGEIIKGSTINIEYLPQDIEFDQELTVLEQVFKGNSDNIRLVKRYREALDKDTVSNKEVLDLSQEMDRKNAWALESEAKTVLTQLGIIDFKKKIKKLSGGQRKRVALASSLINPADLLILDEPTNHLDNTSIEWLETYLINRKGALLMITHDRYFLDRIVNQIVELDRGNIYSYMGNYNYYLEKKIQRDEMEIANERKRRSLLRKELAWMKQGAKARSTKQKARIERYHELSNSELDVSDEKLDISVGTRRLGRKIIEVKNIEKSFGTKKVINNFSFTLLRDDRIGILGPNGSGKSTLMNILIGRIEPDKGIVDIGETVKIGYFTQETEYMDEDMRAIEYIRQGGEFIQTGEGEKISASQMMENFLFQKEEQWTPLGKLSGGEKRRLYLLRVLMESPNILLLDEPTNDLDINTLTVLEDYIERFAGAVIVVSHDRYLLNKVVDRVFVFEDNGDIKEYTGNYDYFKDQSKLVEEDNIKEEKPIKSERQKEKTLKFSFNEQRQWESIDMDIEELEKQIISIENQMEKASSEYSKLQELMKKKKDIEKKLDEKMENWIYLSELAEKIEEDKRQ